MANAHELARGHKRLRALIEFALAEGWHVNQWLKKAVLLSFRLNDNRVMDGGSAGNPAYDKVPSKFAGWDEARFRDAGCRYIVLNAIGEPKDEREQFERLAADVVPRLR